MLTPNASSLGPVQALNLSVGVRSVQTEGVYVWCSEADSDSANYKKVHLMLPDKISEKKKKNFQVRNLFPYIMKDKLKSLCLYIIIHSS